jgi:hypothetical protein
MDVRVVAGAPRLDRGGLLGTAAWIALAVAVVLIIAWAL